MAVLMLTALSTVGYCADYNNWGNTDTYQLLGRELPYDSIYAGVQRGGVSAMVSGSTTIPLTYGYVTKAIGEGVGTVHTLADGVPGQIITVFAISRASSGTAVITPTTKTGYSTVTLDAAYEYVTLLFLDSTNGWVIVATNGTVA
jgi:hypothetical protein